MVGSHYHTLSWRSSMGDGVTQSSAVLGIEAAGASSGAAAIVRNSGITLQSPQSTDITRTCIKLRIYM